MKMFVIAIFLCFVAGCGFASADLITFGDKDVLGTGSYPSEPTDGATLTGLAAGQVTFGGPAVSHGFPFSPDVDDFAGTDQIYTSSTQSGFGDGYSRFSGRLLGPQEFTLDYSSVVNPGAAVESLTLGIAADDFQFSLFGQPFVASVNGVVNDDLSNVLNGLTQTGPQVQFFTIGLDVSSLNSNNQLVLSIDQDGDGRDGWAVDFLTVGVTSVPEPTNVLFCLAAISLGVRRRR